MENPEREKLIWNYLDGTLPEDKVTLLSEWLRESPENVRNFLLKAAVHRQLSEVFREGLFAKDHLANLSCRVDDESSGQVRSLTAADTKRHTASTAPGWLGMLRNPLFSGALAASLLTIVYFSFGMLRWPDNSTLKSSADSVAQSEGSLDHEANGSLPVATITGVLDADWKNKENSASYGEPLTEGRKLSLEGGLVQLTFESGAKLLVQGPTDFVVQSEMRGVLDAGKITAVVPSRAHGFTVRTPTAEIIDLGTEFALQVDDLGGAEVHVLDGEVITQALNRDGALVGDIVHVTEHKAVSYTADSPAVSTINYNASKFRRELEPRLSDDELPALPIRKSLALWLAADQLVKLDEDKRVIAWRDILTGDNQSAEDAFQHIHQSRPQWVEKGINQRPSIRFDGKSDLVTTPMETTNDQTVSLVFSINWKAINRKGSGGQILNYNGPPSRLLRKMSQPGVLQIGDFKAAKRGLFSAFVYCVNNGEGIQSGKPPAFKATPGEPVVMTYVYDRSNKIAKMYINGKNQGTSTASSLPAITSRKVIGRHGAHPEYFIGDLSELLIYNAALTETDCASLNQYLMERYDILSAEAALNLTL